MTTRQYKNMANRINSGIETVISLIDISPSMEFDDWKPSRLDGAIRANRELIRAKHKSYPKDKMGIIGFGGTAELLHSPVTLNEGLASLHKALDIEYTSCSTNFIAALELAEACFYGKSAPAGTNVVSRMLSKLFFETSPQEPVQLTGSNRAILLTDGEHNCGGSPVKVAARLKNAGIVIDCIGIGGTPDDVDEALLKQIASMNPDGSIRYCFIGDQAQLLEKYESLASRIVAV